MFGIEFLEITLFVKQLGFVMAGAAALWGFLISRRDFKCGERECIIHDWIAIRLFNVFVGGVVVAALGLLAALSKIRFNVFAHEGIVIEPTNLDIYKALLVSSPVFLLVLVLTVAFLFVKVKHPKKFSRWLTPFFALSFVLFFILTSLTAIGEDLRENLFFIGHGFHSIFTLGSVLVLDFLFLTSRNSRHLKEHIYPLFPTISKVVWVGLLFDFIASYLILPEFIVTSKFFFQQSVIGILIINGAILSGLIARNLINFNKEKGLGQKRWRLAANISGAISVVSWLSITFVDFFRDLSLEYFHLISAYVLMVIIVFILHSFLEKYEKMKKVAF